MRRQSLLLCLCLLFGLLMVLPLSARANAGSATSTPIVDDEGYTIYTVSANDTLSGIATRFGVSVRAIMNANDLTNPDLVIIGQRLRIPATADTTGATPTLATGTPDAATTPEPPGIDILPDLTLTPDATDLTDPEATPEAEATAIIIPDEFTAQTVAPLPAFNYGIEAHLPQGIDAEYERLSALNLGWVKLFVHWRDVEAIPNQFDYANLDAAIDRFSADGVNILLTVTSAPAWTRTSQSEDGPPDQVDEYAAFVGALAERYVGRVAAYQVWHEPNIRREWNSAQHPISADSYLALLRSAYTAIKTADPAARVISAGLAPTGFNDGINAVDDQRYLEALYQGGLATISDAIGVHPAGWANPPDAVCCISAEGVTTHYQNPRFYFRETLDAYRQIMTQYGDDAPMWITQFGWGSSADTTTPPNNFNYVGFVSLEQQAAYNLDAFEIGAARGDVQVMILKNYDGCALTPFNAELCYFSVLNPQGTPRPLYDALRLVFGTADSDN